MKIIRLFSEIEYPKIDPFQIPEEWKGQYDTVEVRLHVDDSLWEREMKLLVSEINKARARKIKNSIKSNPLFLFADNPKIVGERTHPLAKFSTDKKQVWSKDISTNDRFLYDVDPPVLDKLNRKVIFDVRVQNLSDHKYKGRHYSETIKLKSGLKIKLI